MFLTHKFTALYVIQIHKHIIRINLRTQHQEPTTTTTITERIRKKKSKTKQQKNVWRLANETHAVVVISSYCRIAIFSLLYLYVICRSLSFSMSTSWIIMNRLFSQNETNKIYQKNKYRSFSSFYFGLVLYSVQMEQKISLTGPFYHIQTISIFALFRISMSISFVIILSFVLFVIICHDFSYIHRVLRCWGMVERRARCTLNSISYWFQLR